VAELKLFFEPKAFLQAVRDRKVPLRGRLKKNSQASLEAFAAGLCSAFPEARGKPFARALSKLWVRWMAFLPDNGPPDIFSERTGHEVGVILREEYAEGVAGGLAVFLMDKRLHLDGVHGFLKMRAWLRETIEALRLSRDPSSKARAEILSANFSSITLRAQHNAGPGYAAEVVGKLASLTKDLDAAIANLEKTEPEAAFYLKQNRATVVARALHSGDLDYSERAAAALPHALKDLDRRIEKLSTDAPNDAESLRARKRTWIYRGLTNGRFRH
jgi:hypothetical protein